MPRIPSLSHEDALRRFNLQELADAELAKFPYLLAMGWKFSWDSAVRRFGICRYNTRTVSVSWPLTSLNSDSAFLDCLHHEIAHALTPGSGHGPDWKRTAISIGCSSSDRCYSSTTIKQPEKRWIAICRTCGFKHGKNRRPRRNGTTACKPCCQKYNGGKYSAAHTLMFTLNPEVT